MPQQRRLDLPRLNAKTADLHLLVRATHKLQHPIPAPARQVPAAVHPAARSPKPVRNKALPSQTTTAQITARNTSPRHVKLPNYPHRHWLQTTIQYVHPPTGNAPTDEAATACDRKLPVWHTWGDKHR